MSPDLHTVDWLIGGCTLALAVLVVALYIRTHDRQKRNHEETGRKIDVVGQKVGDVEQAVQSVDKGVEGVRVQISDNTDAARLREEKADKQQRKFQTGIFNHFLEWLRSVTPSKAKEEPVKPNGAAVPKTEERRDDQT